MKATHMDDIELDNIDKGRERERERERSEREETSFNEETRRSDKDYEKARDRIDSGTTNQGETSGDVDLGDDDDDPIVSNLKRSVREYNERKGEERFSAILALESLEGTEFNVNDGPKSKELIDNISDASMIRIINSSN